MTLARIRDIRRYELLQAAYELMDGCYLLATDEPQITRSVALNLIANHIRIIIPNFDMSAVKIDSALVNKAGRKR